MHAPRRYGSEIHLLMKQIISAQIFKALDNLVSIGPLLRTVNGMRRLLPVSFVRTEQLQVEQRYVNIQGLRQGLI